MNSIIGVLVLVFAPPLVCDNCNISEPLQMQCLAWHQGCGSGSEQQALSASITINSAPKPPATSPTVPRTKVSGNMLANHVEKNHVLYFSGDPGDLGEKSRPTSFCHRHRHLSSSVIITPCQSLLPIVFRQCKQVTKMLQKLVVE